MNKRLGVISLLVTGIATQAVSQQDTAVGRRLLVDSLEPRGPTSSLSELLTSRFPGVLVWSSSGEVGTSSRILMRGPNTILGNGAPLVVVDGMVVDANPASFLSNIGGQQISRLNDLDPADISSIQVVDGAAEGAPYGTGAANGVLVITTRQGEVGPPRFRFTSTQGFDADPHTFPASLTPGPGGLPQVNPLEDPTTSPFRAGYVRDYRAEVSGGWAPATYYLSAHFEGVGGVYGLPASEQDRLAAAGTLHPENLNPNDLERLNLRAGGRISIAHQADITVSGWAVSSSLRLPNNDDAIYGILADGELATPGTLSPWAFALPGDLFQIVTAENLLRLTGTVKAEWRPTDWLHVDGLVGHESVRQRDLQYQRPGEGPPTGSLGLLERDTLRQASTTYRSTASARATLGVFAFSTLVGVETRHTDQKTWQHRGTFLPGGGETLTVGFLGQTAFGILADEQIDLGGRLQADVGARVDHLKAFDVPGPATTYPHVSLSWRAHDDVRIRGGWGRVGNDDASFPGTVPEITSEVEGGADGTLLRGALQLSITGYGRHSRAETRVLPPPSLPFPPLQVLGTIENTGVIVAADVRLVRTSRLDWKAQLGLWGNRNRIVGLPFPLVAGPRQLLTNGYPIAAYYMQQILGYSDANADGVIESGEVQVSSAASYAGNPFPTQGATLGTTLRIGRGLRAGLLAEYRAGNQIFDQTESFRCLVRVCEGVNTKAPLPDQAAAAVAGFADAPFVSDAAFLKLREVSVSIAAPDGWARAIRCTGATLTLAGRNLITLTSYKGLDPEVSSMGAAGLTVVDLFTQPPVRTVAARVDLAF